MKEREKTKKKWKERKKYPQSFSDLWDTVKRSNIYIIEVPKQEKRRGDRKISEEINSQNFSTFDENQKSTDPRSSRDSRKNKENHVKAHDKLLKISNKEKMLKACREKRYIQRNEAKNDTRLLIRNYASQKTTK